MSDLPEGFEEIEPVAAAKPATSPVTIGVSCLGRKKTMKIVVSIASEVAAQIENNGWPRFRAAYKTAKHEIALVGEVQGKWEAMRSPKGGRVLLRIAPPLVWQLRAWDKVEPTWSIENGWLVIKLPAILLRPAVAGEREAGEAKVVKAAEKAAVLKYPAPKF